MKCLNIESRIILPLFKIIVKFPSVGWGTLDYISLLYMKDNHDMDMLIVIVVFYQYLLFAHQDNQVTLFVYNGKKVVGTILLGFS